MNASSPPIAPAMPANRLFEWSIRREFWENRSLYIAPLSVAAVVLFGSAIGAISLPRRRQAVLMMDPARQHAAIERPYDQVVMVILLTAFIVGAFYCLDALYGERRDRSLLFWKSLPVSDTTTVLSKASIPLVFLPLLSFAIRRVISRRLSACCPFWSSRRSGTRRSTAGCCSYRRGPGAPCFFGPSCRRS
jgi:ABC-2 type transport system permease protein